MNSPDITWGMSEVYLTLQKMLFPFLRFSAFFWFMPLYASGSLIFVARLALAAILAGYAIRVTDLPALPLFSITGVVVALEQIVFSMLFALSAHFFFQVFKVSGSILSSQMGLSMASMADPTTGESEPLVSQLLYYSAIFFFFSLGMHGLMLELLMQSLSTWPIGTPLFSLHISALLPMLGWVFSSAFSLIVPVVACLLLINIAFGVLGKVSPSFNVFSMGFSIVILVGFFMTALWLSNSAGTYPRVMQAIVTVLQAFQGIR